MHRGIFFLFACICMTVADNSEPFDEFSLKEIKCLHNLPKPFLNSTWYNGVEKWYVPFWSKLDAYRVIADALQKKIEDVYEEEILTSCPVADSNFTLTVFNSKRESGQTPYNITYEDDTKINFHWESSNGLKGSYNTVMTDNESFFVGIPCWEDGESTWEILSTTPKLDPKIEKLVLNFVVSLGFKSSFILKNDYKDC